MYMVLLVLDDPDRLEDVLRAWEATGIRGATITESTGIHRLRGAAPLGARYAFGRGQGLVEEGHYTLFSIVPDQDAVERCLHATEEVVGDLDQPNTGILAAWPLAIAKGVPADAGREASG